MRHGVHQHSFSRRLKPRLALIQGLVNALVEHERIEVTITKAKELRRHVERAITMGKKGDLHTTRVLMSRLGNSDAVTKIMKDLSPRFKTRPGGYTRILKTGVRAGDNAPMAIIEFVDYQLPAAAKTKDTTVKGDAGATKRAKAAAKGAKAQKKTAKKKTAKARKSAKKS